MLSLLQFQNIPVAAQKVDEHQKIFAKLNTIYFLSFTGKSRRLRMLKSCLTKSVMIWISECIILDMYTVLFDMSSIIGAVTKGSCWIFSYLPIGFRDKAL